ncbi:unnamed protein product [Effrenium voratum]|nr:unnamed protein product [Effrenium voratum]
MRALSNAASNVPRLVSSFATVNIKGCDQRFDFYCPIHDAAYLGQKDAVLWLLEHKARADAINKDGCTPLHFIALIGGRGNLMDSDVQEVVSALLTHCANLDARSFSAQQPYPCDDPFLQQKIPLEIAAETQYPKDLMYLMAASFQSINFDNPRAFADIRLLSKCNMKVAEDFTHDLLERARNDSTLLDMLIKEAQMNGAVDRIAALLYMVPHAGAEILDALTVPPVIQDAAKHPLPSRAPLHTGPARCTYQPDMVQRRDLMWPQWEYDADNQVQKRWHARFVPKRAADIRQDNVYDVDVKVVLLPNLLDVDIFMALTRTWETHNHVFAKLPIQGAIYCLWDQLLWPVFASHWLFMGLELGVLPPVRNLQLHVTELLRELLPEFPKSAFSRRDQRGQSEKDRGERGRGVAFHAERISLVVASPLAKPQSIQATAFAMECRVNFFTDAWFLSSLLTLSCRLLLVLPCLYDSFFPDHDPEAAGNAEAPTGALPTRALAGPWSASSSRSDSLALAAAPWLLKALLRILDTLPILGACLISISQIAWQAMLIQADWFQPDAPELAPGVEVVKTSGEGHGVVECQQGDLWKVKLSHANGEEFYLAKESELAIQNCGFLWICHRSDYAETFFFETEEVSRKDLDHVAHQLDETNKRLDHLERVLGDKLDVLLKLSDLEADI